MGKVIVVTGASSGFGAMSARSLARAGHTVYATMRDTAGRNAPQVEAVVPLGRELLPGAAILSLRGNVLENGMRRFFRRLAEGIFDEQDLERRTEELARFIERARREYTLEDNSVVGAGYSNGANIAASLILRYPRHVSGAVLFRAMVPFTPERIPNLGALKIFLGAGDRDPIVPVANTRRLASMLQSGGAEVSLYWHTGGHELGQDDLDAAKLWLARQRSLMNRHA